MYPTRKGMPFYGSLLILGLLRYYPLNNQNKKQFFIILFFWTLFWTVIFATTTITECIINLNRHNYFMATTALPVAIGTCVLSVTNIIFATNHALWSKLLKNVAECSQFGTSPHFDSIKHEGDKIGILYMILILSVVFISAVYELMEEKSCLAHFGDNGACGLITATWLPPWFENSLIYKRLMLLYQLLAVVVIASFTIVVTLQYQICQFIEDKSEHLFVLFDEMHIDENTNLQKRKFAFCIEYHQYMLYLCEELDFICRRTLGHVTFSTSVVIAFLLYHGINGNYKFFLYAPAYILNLWFMCHTGQKLEDAMSNVGNYLYLSHWYECCSDIRNVIPLVIRRSQRSTGLQAVPIGRLNYMLFVVVVKSAYTYLNLITHSSET